VTITGKPGGAFKGSKTLTFNILPKKPSALKAKAGKKSIKVSFKKVSGAQKVKTYKVEYRIKGAAKWKSKTVKVKLTGKAAKQKSVTFTLKGLKSKKTYELRVYAYKGSYKGLPTGVRRVKVK
jgi:fructan beta-fructosidase